MLCTYCGYDGVADGMRCPLCARAVGPLTPPAEAAETRVMDTPPPGSPGSVHTGSLFAGAYLVESVLGRGGMGTVYRVTETSSGRSLALKLLHRQLIEVEEAAGRFRRETEILTRLNHPSIPRIVASGVVDGRLYLVTELVEGDDLRTCLRQSGPIAVDTAVRIAGDLADALQAAHERGVIHRDVKPHNIMICPDGSVRLLDFGVARQVGINARTITITGTILGTPEYMSPEQFEGHRVDGRSDLYSLGVVLFEMVTGRLPFEGDTPMAFAIHHMKTPPPPPREIRADLPGWLNRTILRCLEKKPAARFPTAADLAAELRHSHDKSSVKRLPTGDIAVFDDSLSGSTLLICCRAERPDWAPGMALRYADEYFRLDLVTRDESMPLPCVYQFSCWPPGEVFRKFVDYASVAPVRGPGILSWMKGRTR